MEFNEFRESRTNNRCRGFISINRLVIEFLEFIPIATHSGHVVDIFVMEKSICTHVNSEISDVECFHRWTLVRGVTIEFSSLLVPFDSIKSSALQVIPAI